MVLDKQQLLAFEITQCVVEQAGQHPFHLAYTYLNISRHWIWGITQTSQFFANVHDLLVSERTCWEHACKCPRSLCKLPLQCSARFQYAWNSTHADHVYIFCQLCWPSFPRMPFWAHCASQSFPYTFAKVKPPYTNRVGDGELQGTKERKCIQHTETWYKN